MDRKDTLKAIDKHYEDGSTLAINLIESEARKILTADPDLDKFVMAMGSCFFTYKDGGKYDMLRDGLTDEIVENLDPEDDWFGRAEKGIIQDENFQAEFLEMVDELNDVFKVMGYPMKFTATGKIINDW